MAIRIFLTQEGNIEINSLKQENFSIEDDGVSILFPFKTIEKGEHHMVVDPGDKLGEVLEYIIAELTKLKFTYELDQNLKQYLANYTFEKRKLKQLKNKRLERTQFQHKIFQKDRSPLPHQTNGIWHALNVENAANFSVPGSGKTQIALGAFVLWKKGGLVEKSLVIGPASCFEPWEEEAKDCLKDKIKILRWSGSISERRRIGSLIKDVDLVLVTYHTACNDYLLFEQLLRRYKFLLILDESHYIKNPGSARAQMAIRLSHFACKRLILTGTPAPHSLLDIWTQFSFLWPSRLLLHDFQSFKERVEKSKDPVASLKKGLAPFFIRTTKKELGLPDIKSNIIPIKIEAIPFEQKKIIELLELKTLVEARRLKVSEMDLNVLRRWRAARIIRLLQAASNPSLLLSRLDFCNNGDDIDTSDLIRYASTFLDRKKIPAKVKTVIDIAKSLVGAGRKVIIWTWFVGNIKLLEELLNRYHPLKIYGGIKPYEDENSETEESREKNIHEFKTRKDRSILLANPAACAESISLHKHCQHAIYLDRNFNCGQFLQSMDRIHRVGMPEGTTAEYHIPFINCAIERAIDNRLKKRQADLYRLLSDPMPVLAIDEELWLADTYNDIDEAYSELIRDLKNHAKKSL